MKKNNDSICLTTKQWAARTGASGSQLHFVGG
jgi:hypothetical protein